MATLISILTFAFIISPPANFSLQEVNAEQVIRQYLKMPLSEDDRFGGARTERQEILNQLKSVPDDGITAIDNILPQIKNPLQRIELAETLERHFPGEKSAAILCKLLKDPDDKVRWQAIHSLRMLARRTDRIGPARTQLIPDTRSRAEKEKEARVAIQTGKPSVRQRIQPQDERLEDFVEFSPKVEGLVPYLVSAANDQVEDNRICALYALADTRDPLAVIELRERLKDPSEKVRVYAACFLTEYQESSGLMEMRNALIKLCLAKPDDTLDYYDQAARLLASFERITGKSFGEIPMSPYLSSDTGQITEIKKTFDNLLKVWSQWWEWEPNRQE